MSLKSLKNQFKTYLLTKKLKKNNILFNLSDFTFSDKNVLIIDEIIPEFNKDSGSRRLTEIIKLLLKNKVSVFLIADLKQYKYKSDYIKKFKDLGVNVYQPSIDQKGQLVTKEDFIKLITPKIDVAWLHRPTIFSKFQSLVKTANPNIKLVFDMVDFHYVRLLREYELNKDEALKAEAEKFLKIELENCKNADVVIAISTTDKELLKQHFNTNEKVVLISNIHQHIDKSDKFNSFEKRNDLLFVGSFRHDPNSDAVKYLKENIMPLVWKVIPDLKVNIIGSYITDDIEALASDRFKLLGFVDDLDAVINTTKLFVAPLRFGAGIKGKIGQSLEHSLPLVTTNVGAEGFDFGEQTNVMIANNAEAIAQKVIDLYTNKILWEEASNSCKTILEPFSLKVTENQVLQII
ncbi:glycosyltransferase family 4 protein [Olleya marilimosa]|uniref:Glycosyltransferase family 4 protein n=1 Tax=Olleya marilimosa TaxID=272164 RepID=A0ABR8LRP8_9FLAO|nr:glycosyltransferase family 4 protein [Olleya marilimosa]MBD3862525.1 glycosyltransferase family 4 protein [Olleya marilimosa]MBD3890024.1 glycosyltransferase family 4 protein [Olleya marilimosa]